MAAPSLEELSWLLQHESPGFPLSLGCFLTVFFSDLPPSVAPLFLSTLMLADLPHL